MMKGLGISLKLSGVSNPRRVQHAGGPLGVVGGPVKLAAALRHHARDPLRSLATLGITCGWNGHYARTPEPAQNAGVAAVGQLVLHCHVGRTTPDHVTGTRDLLYSLRRL